MSKIKLQHEDYVRFPAFPKDRKRNIIPRSKWLPNSFIHYFHYQIMLLLHLFTCSWPTSRGRRWSVWLKYLLFSTKGAQFVIKITSASTVDKDRAQDLKVPVISFDGLTAKVYYLVVQFCIAPSSDSSFPSITNFYWIYIT